MSDIAFGNNSRSIEYKYLIIFEDEERLSDCGSSDPH